MTEQNDAAMLAELTEKCAKTAAPRSDAQMIAAYEAERSSRKACGTWTYSAINVDTEDFDRLLELAEIGRRTLATMAQFASLRYVPKESGAVMPEESLGFLPPDSSRTVPVTIRRVDDPPLLPIEKGNGDE